MDFRQTLDLAIEGLAVAAVLAEESGRKGLAKRLKGDIKDIILQTPFSEDWKEKLAYDLDQARKTVRRARVTG